jgi:hypothetical protein
MSVVFIAFVTISFMFTPIQSLYKHKPEDQIHRMLIIFEIDLFLNRMAFNFMILFLDGKDVGLAITCAMALTG